MLCDACKKREAVFHTVQQVNGLRAEVHLCAHCHRMLAGEGISDLTGTLFSDFAMMFGERNVTRKVCKKCGTTEEEFLSTGYLGCERCYETFSAVTMPRIAQMQQGTRHIGKRPVKQEQSPEDEYNRLSAELKKAVEIEDYERAARIQAQLRALRENQ